MLEIFFNGNNQYGQKSPTFFFFFWIPPSKEGGLTEYPLVVSEWTTTCEDIYAYSGWRTHGQVSSNQTKTIILLVNAASNEQCCACVDGRGSWSSPAVKSAIVTPEYFSVLGKYVRSQMTSCTESVVLRSRSWMQLLPL